MSDANNGIIRLGHIVEHTEIYGPGIRAAIWVKGCTLACKGCWNTQYWPAKGGELIPVMELHQRLMEIEDIEGITLLGGEPLQQSSQVLELIELQKKAGRTIMLYSGYEKEELDEVQSKCVELSDLVILGRYREDLRNTSLRWRGSENQELYSPTGRYDVASILDGDNEVSVHIDQQGQISIHGYPDDDVLSNLLDELINQA